MLSRNLTLCALLAVLGALLLDSPVEARYLPTRSNGDRIDKIGELLEELLENKMEREEMRDISRRYPDSKIFKREAKESQQSLPQQ